MAKRERNAWMEIDFFCMSEIKDIAKASGARLRYPHEGGWEFCTIEDEIKMKRFIVNAAVQKARGKT